MDFRFVRKCVVLIAIFFILVSFTAYAGEKNEKETPKTKAAEAPKPPPENAAIVNGKKIPFDVFAVELEAHRRRIQQQGQHVPGQMLPKLRSQVLDSLITEELLLQEATKKGIKTDEAVVEKEMAAIKGRFKDPKEYETTLANMKMSEKVLRQQIGQRTTIREFVEKEISSGIEVKDKDAKTFYDENPTYFQRPEQVHARHILIKVSKSASDEDKGAARKKIEAIKKRIDKGEDFGELAKTESEGPSSTKGGDLGFFGKGRMVKAFEDVAFALKKNEISDVVETQFGYHLIQNLGHKDADKVPFKDVKDRIVNNLRNEKIKEEVQTYVKNLREKSKIERFID